MSRDKNKVVIMSSDIYLIAKQRKTRITPAGTETALTVNPRKNTSQNNPQCLIGELMEVQLYILTAMNASDTA